MQISPVERDAHNAEHNAIPTQKAYFVGAHPYHFQAGVPAEILGVKVIVAPDGITPRPCYHLRFPDGREDYAVMQDQDMVGKAGLGILYHIIPEDQAAGRISAIETEMKRARDSLGPGFHLPV